uniref:Angiotensin I, ANG I n=1 Tax=Alligator mississippiensis TaxID=8496 RepID=Q9PS07_ALLMI|nr:angiotensin I, ANG I [Alligator mississippiensis=alligators, American, plasma, Peptide, 10 aa] [Alligator mississippiensis]
DRVYVHPFAL